RIGRARDKVTAATPYARAITQAVSALATHSTVPHALTSERTDTKRVAVLVVTADRGMAGAYSATAIREAEKLIEQLTDRGLETDLYALGRRAVSYYQFRQREITASWTGSSDSPSAAPAQEVADTLLSSFLAPAEEGGVKELHVVFTQFKNMVSQTPRVIRMLPIEVVEADEAVSPEELAPLYEFEPSPETVLDALLPRYV